MNKVRLILLLLLIFCFIATGCFEQNKQDSMQTYLIQYTKDYTTFDSYTCQPSEGETLTYDFYMN